ncbi:hypothetical protein [Allosphingosinicella indica]|uniref:Uncharacterized protein n=1 Tax=Allosphingosinicella indica TaxID=941907 RepID=A0A1X7GKA8_9SPHN|nr:hypothetical protein [Allosphingosinicella indica]SMF70631.1 hypothetical protein SAMN06295910_1914 [Allosphingosinicella indica]
MTAPVVVIHFLADGDTTYRVFGDGPVRVLFVDEKAPHDRVYEWLSREPMEDLAAIVPEGGAVGSKSDARHPAIANAIEAALEGRPHLRPVE